MPNEPSLTPPLTTLKSWITFLWKRQKKPQSYLNFWIKFSRASSHFQKQLRHLEIFMYYFCFTGLVSLQGLLLAVDNSHTLWHPETMPSTGWGYWVMLISHMASDESRTWAQFTWVSHVNRWLQCFWKLYPVPEEVTAVNHRSSKWDRVHEVSFRY